MKKCMVIILCLSAIAFGINKRYRRPQANTVGLVAHYKLWATPMSWTTSDGAGKIFDYSLSGFTGSLTAIADPTNLIPAFPAYPGFIFDGSYDYIDIGTGPTSVKTISLWVKQDDVSGNEYPIDLNGTDYLSIESGKVTVNGLSGHSLYVNSAAATSGTTTITALTWAHIVITDATANNASDFDIGRVTAAYYDGLIADVRLYSRVLAAGEIKDLYESTRWRYQK